MMQSVWDTFCTHFLLYMRLRTLHDSGGGKGRYEALVREISRITREIYFPQKVFVETPRDEDKDLHSNKDAAAASSSEPSLASSRAGVSSYGDRQIDCV